MDASLIAWVSQNYGTASGALVVIAMVVIASLTVWLVMIWAPITALLILAVGLLLVVLEATRNARRK